LTNHAHCHDDQALVEPDAHLTSTLHQVDDHSVLVPNIRITLASPPRPDVSATLGLEPFVLGSGVGSDFIVADRQVSRRHCELKLTPRGIVLRDLGSKNGTFIDHVPIIEAILDFGRVARIGNSQFKASTMGSPSVVPLSMGGRFGEAVGNSIVMRALFAKLERASATSETILLLGESGTGKEVLARAVHDASPRRNGPFVVLDCGAVTPSLLEAELFGHTRGAFTGAATARVGLLEEAGHGTLFIDEIGEMPLELQPKLLRALEAREIRRVGSTEARPLHARVIAATHRNLRANIANGSFREDLYYRLAVVEMHVPALRDRKEDIPLLVEHLLQKQQPGIRASAFPQHAMNLLMAHDWPGNVRELRNVVTRLLLFPDLVGDIFDNMGRRIADRGPPSPPSDSHGNVQALLKLSLKEMREVALEQIEARYLAEKQRLHRFNISRMAEDIGVSRTLLYRLLERHGLRPKSDDGQGDEG
jgi:two-component system, NtrC family, response regulator GlrR